MILALLQARMGSTRLPGKVLKSVLGHPVLQLQIERIQRSQLIDKLVVVTSLNAEDQAIKKLCDKLNIPCFCGSLDDVLDRFYQASLLYQPKHVVRLTGDCPVIDPEVIDEVINYYLQNKFDYTSNTLTPTFPDGLDVEIFKYKHLINAWENAKTAHQREHVTPFIRSLEGCVLGSYENEMDHSHLRWTLDEPEDYKFICKVYEKLYHGKKHFNRHDIFKLLDQDASLTKINSMHIRNAGSKINKYEKTHQLFDKAKKIIPLASQTYSKCYLNFPQEDMPLFLERGEGSHVWDIDGNEYIDCMSGLLSISLGYNHPNMNQVITDQLKKGISFSLATKLEYEVAQKIINLVPCAQMVRFGKNGSDVTSGAIKLARTYTGREHIAVCGYHGWHDWYMASTANKTGIPSAIGKLTHAFGYNDIQSLESIFVENPGQIAAVILEPMNKIFPKNNFLQNVKALTHKHGAILIFDEMITGFRFAVGGASEYFNVTPDLVTLGKGMANGMPLSALAGRSEIMSLIKDIHFSFTFGGETLSLAASSFVLDFIKEHNVPAELVLKGKYLKAKFNAMVRQFNLEKHISLIGHETWQFVQFSDMPTISKDNMMMLWKREMINQGILISTSFNLMYMHSMYDLEKICIALENVMRKFSNIYEGKTMINPENIFEHNAYSLR